MEIDRNSLTDKYKIASSHRRVIAWVLDLILILAFVRVSIVPFFYPTSWDMLIFNQIIYSIYPIIFFIFVILLFKDIINGQSYGKWFCNLKIVYIQENLPVCSFWTSIKRNFFLLLGPIEIGYFLFDKFHRRIGDKVFGTLVVCKNQNLVIRFITKRLISFLMILGGFWIINQLSSPLFIEKSSYYKQAISYLNNKALFHEAFKISYFNKQLYNTENKKILSLRVKYLGNSYETILYFSNLPKNKHKIVDIKINEIKKTK